MNSEDKLVMEEVDGTIVGRVYTNGMNKTCIYIVPCKENMNLFSGHQIQQIDNDFF